MRTGGIAGRNVRAGSGVGTEEGPQDVAQDLWILGEPAQAAGAPLLAEGHVDAQALALGAQALAEVRARGAQYIVGTPKGRLTALEQQLLALPWQAARPSVQVKLLPRADELYVWVQSAARVAKERAMRRRKLGAAKQEAGRAWTLVRVELPAPPPQGERARRVDFTFTLDKAKLRRVRRREGRYLLRSNLTETDPARLWACYLQLVEVEAAFKDLKGDLAIRPIFHRLPARIEAHIFVAFLAYCLHATLKAHLRPRAPGLTVRQVLEKFAAMQMLDVHFPTTDGRELIFTRYTQPEPDQQLLLAQLRWTLPSQPPPRITAKRAVQM